jgi:hypothetical protein
MDPKTELDYKREAAQLRLLRRSDQEDIVGMYRHRARNPKRSVQERREDRERASALSRLLGLPRRRA